MKAFGLGLSYCCIICMTSAQALAEEARSAKQPNNPMSKAFNYMRMGDDLNALKVLDNALETSPDANLYRMRAEAELNLKRYKDAISDVAQAQKLNPKDIDATRVRARIYLAKGDFAAALKNFDEAIRLDPSNHVFRYDRARLLERLGQPGSAVLDYTEAIKFTKRDNRAKLYEARGKCYLTMKAYDKAVDDFTLALTSSLRRSELLKLRATAYKALGKESLAQQDRQESDAVDEIFKPPSTLGN